MRVCVFGDVALDVTYSGKASRVDQGGQAVVYSGTDTTYRAGCAGNVATLLAKNGHQVDLVARVGEDDPWTPILVAELVSNGVGVDYLLEDSQCTTVKIRCVAKGETAVQDNVVGRWDNDRTTAPLMSRLHPEIDWSVYDCLVISDYNKDVIMRDSQVLHNVPGSLPVIADVKEFKSHKPLSTPIWWVTPNLQEWKERWGAGHVPGAARDFLYPWAKVAHGVAITMGKDGAKLRGVGGTICAEPAPLTGPAPYTCGAGDAFIARFAVAIANNDTPKKALEVATLEASRYAIEGAHKWMT